MGFLGGRIEVTLGKPSRKGWTKPHSRKSPNRTGGRLRVIPSDTLDKDTKVPDIEDSDDNATSLAGTDQSVSDAAHMEPQLGAAESSTRRSSLSVSDPQAPSSSNASSRRSSDAGSSAKVAPRSRPASPVATRRDPLRQLPLRSDLPGGPDASQAGGQTLMKPPEHTHGRRHSTSSQYSQSSGCSKEDDTAPHSHLTSRSETSMSPSESASNFRRTPSPTASHISIKYLEVEVFNTSLENLREETRRKVAARRQASALATKEDAGVGSSIAVTDDATRALSDTGPRGRGVRRPSPGLVGKQCANTTSTLARIAEFYQDSASGSLKPSDLFGDMSVSEERALVSAYLGQRGIPSASTPGSHTGAVSTLEGWDSYVSQEPDSCIGAMRWAYDNEVLLPSIAKDWEKSARQTHAAATKRLRRDWDRQTEWMAQAGELSESDMIARRNAYLGWLDGRFATDDSHLVRRTSNHVSFAEQVKSEASSDTVGPG